jgi:hypothetical protein
MPLPIRSLLLTITLLLGARGAAAQVESPRGSLPFVVRAAVMRGAEVCVCSAEGQPAPRDRDLYTLTVGTEWELAGTARLQLSYAADVIPFLLSQNTADEGLSVWSCGVNYCGNATSPYPWRTSAVGFGALPIGLVVRVRPGSAFALRARASGGAVYLSRPVPVMQSRNFNFVAEASVGAEVRLVRGVALGVGLTHNHISNANTAPVNLGMDTRLVELGFTFSR